MFIFRVQIYNKNGQETLITFPTSAYLLHLLMESDGPFSAPSIVVD
jgi:hypothetical protein